ncbi:MAG: hypothetical protein J3Q66DRAFT_393276 [Benniella sp.]|nr:MAG: hypothetical protein J3Q66DRAFT_393276 [Benniella sp.]
MTRLPSALLLLAVAITANAQQDGCANKIQVSSEADLAPIASCTTFSGSVTISGTTMNAKNWPALQSLTGSIKFASNPLLTTLSLDGLQSSTGSISLFNNTALSTINVPNIKSLSNLEIVTAPALRQLPLPTIQSIGSLKLEDTGLDNTGALPWSNLPKATDLGVNNNKFLKNLEMPRLTEVSVRFVVAANGLMEGQQVTNCTFRHLTDLQIPQLSQVGASLAFDETNLQTILAPKLKAVGQTLSIVSNNWLMNLTFTELASIGGALLIANNTELTNVDGFKQLKDISGVLNMRGAFNNVSLPTVSTVQGGMSVLSSSKDVESGQGSGSW